MQVRIGLLIAAAAGMMLLAGCSGRPDVGGQWGGTLTYVEVNDEEKETGLSFDLGQDSDGSLTGTMSLETGDDETASSPISSGEVTEDGSVRIEIESQDALDTEPIVFDGEVSGDRLEGDVYDLFQGSGGSFSVERGASMGGAKGTSSSNESAPETIQSSDDEGDFVVPETTAASGQSSQELVSKYNALNEELALMAEELEGRISRLERPAEDLGEALGPDTANPEIFDCASDPVSCEVANLEDQIEEDRRAFEESGYGPAGCEEAEDPDYYAAFRDFDSSGGETYITERDQISENADGLGEYAKQTLKKARETKAAFDAALASEPDGGVYRPNYKVSEVEPMIQDAEAAEERASEAITEAEQRYGALESRAAKALAEAEALYARAGCAI